MPNTQAHRAFVVFMADYTDFLCRMCADENDKFASVSSRELPRIEHSITVSQANAKQFENYEARRMALQAAAGYGGMSFRQLIEAAPRQEQDSLWRLFTRFESSVAEIRFFNDKSMAVARDNMIGIDPALVLPGQRGAKISNPYEKIREEQSRQGNLLEAKV